MPEAQTYPRAVGWYISQCSLCYWSKAAHPQCLRRRHFSEPTDSMVSRCYCEAHIPLSPNRRAGDRKVALLKDTSSRLEYGVFDAEPSSTDDSIDSTKLFAIDRGTIFLEGESMDMGCDVKSSSLDERQARFPGIIDLSRCSYAAYDPCIEQCKDGTSYEVDKYLETSIDSPTMAMNSSDEIV
eukprot:scaffold14697_cov124-Cylindrotheca_fusiformis.AAC.10